MRTVRFVGYPRRAHAQSRELPRHRFAHAARRGAAKAELVSAARGKVRYLIIAHAHGDHDGGAHLIEAAIPGITIIYGEGDWPGVLVRTGPHATRFGPQNDGTDGRVVSVRDVSVKIVTMPGHTPGTLSFLFELKDKGQAIRVAYVGGTAISFTGSELCAMAAKLRATGSL